MKVNPKWKSSESEMKVKKISIFTECEMKAKYKFEISAKLQRKWNESEKIFSHIFYHYSGTVTNALDKIKELWQRYKKRINLNKIDQFNFIKLLNMDQLKDKSLTVDELIYFFIVLNLILDLYELKQ
jgi:hypothetical protein